MAGPRPPHPAEVERRARAAEAGHRGDVAHLAAARRDPDPGVRATALGGLLRAGVVETSDLVAAAGDPHPTVRRRAAEVAAAAGPEAPPTPGDVVLVDLLDDDDPTVVEVAAWACGERPARPGTVSRLAALATGHDDALVREAAVAALGALGEPDGLPAVLGATRDRATVRRRAVLALAPFDGPEVEEALDRAGQDRDWQVRQAAEDLRR